MTAEEHKIRKERFARIRLIKKLLRPLPRRATLHRYPVLGWFAQTARKKSYLWSFRSKEIIPALYAGWMLTLMPLPGLQILLAFLLALGLRANLMVLIGLQLLSNPLTVGPIWLAAYNVGDFFFTFFVTDPTIEPIATDQFEKNTGHSLGQLFSYGFRATLFGGIIIGYFAGFISSFIYQFTAKRASKGYSKIMEKSKKFAEEKKARAESNDHNPSISAQGSHPIHPKKKAT